MRPGGDPDALAAAGQLLAAAAAELEQVGRGLGDLGHHLAAPDAWLGPASAAYRSREGLLDSEIGRGADALRHAATGLSQLAVGLAGAQALWDRAGALAASAGLVLDPADPAGLLPAPLPWGDPRVATAARIAEVAREAAEQARMADQSAAARLAEAAGVAAGVAAGMGPGGGNPGGPAGPAGGGAERPSLLGRGLAVADRVGIAVGAALAATEARARALTRLVSTGREPAAGLAAVRTLAAFDRSALTDTLMAFLPLGGPVITLAANLVEGEDRDEPLVRAVVRSLGESIGADAGQRVGMAVCGAGATATEGAGAILCPAIAVASTSAGATLGGTTAVRIFDALGDDPDHERQPGPRAAGPAAGRRP